MFNWVKVLGKLDDDKFKEMNGIDYALYLVFLRYTGYLCGFISIFNVVLMVPLYASGSPSEIDQEQSASTTMNVLTVLNISGRPAKMQFTFFVALFVFPGFALVMIWMYLTKY